MAKSDKTIEPVWVIKAWNEARSRVSEGGQSLPTIVSAKKIGSDVAMKFENPGTAAMAYGVELLWEDGTVVICRKNHMATSVAYTV